MCFSFSLSHLRFTELLENVNYVFYQICENVDYYFFKYFFCPYCFLSPSGPPITYNVKSFYVVPQFSETLFIFFFSTLDNCCWTVFKSTHSLLCHFCSIEPVSWVFLFFFLTFRCCIFFFLFVVDFVIHLNETAMGLHVFPIPIPPPTSLSTQVLYFLMIKFLFGSFNVFMLCWKLLFFHSFQVCFLYS